jgi:hypothetical protein
MCAEHSPSTAQKMRKANAQAAAGGAIFRRFSVLLGAERPGRGLTRGFSALFSAVL